MEYFTIITGIAGLCGFALQFFDLLPKLGKFRQGVGIFLLGIFCGSLIRGTDTSGLRLSFELTAPTLMLMFFCLALVVLAFVTATTDDVEKRNELYGFCAGTAFFVAFAAIAVGAGSSAGAKEDVSIAERSWLAERAAQNSDFGRAIAHLEHAKAGMSSADERRKLLEKRIAAYHIKEVE